MQLPGGRGDQDEWGEVGERYDPSRWLLLVAHDACHGPGCPLHRVRRGQLLPHVRERATVELFWSLVGHRHSGSEEAMYAEALLVNRKRGTGRVPSQALRRWLMEPPTAMVSNRPASSPAARPASSPGHGVSSATPSPHARPLNPGAVQWKVQSSPG